MVVGELIGCRYYFERVLDSKIIQQYITYLWIICGVMKVNVKTWRIICYYLMIAQLCLTGLLQICKFLRSDRIDRYHTKSFFENTVFSIIGQTGFGLGALIGCSSILHIVRQNRLILIFFKSVVFDAMTITNTFST